MSDRIDNKISEFQKIIIEYWEKHGRKSLPWRNTNDPWKILIAEILLRKTTAVQAVMVYSKIAEMTPNEMAKKRIEDIEEWLKPLGIYRYRGKQIKTIAEKISNDGFQVLGEEELDKLPGVGKYARNAVLCFAYNRPKPALDTNMIRVIERVFGIKSDRSRPREDKALWKYAETIVDREKCREFNWGVLDFAGEICKAKSPKCIECPVSPVCNFMKEKKGENKFSER